MSAQVQPHAHGQAELVNPWEHAATLEDRIFDILTATDFLTPLAAIYLTVFHGDACFVVPQKQYPRLRAALTPQGLPKKVANLVRIKPRWVDSRKGRATFNVPGHRREQAKAMLRAGGMPFRETLLSCIFARDTRPQEKRRRTPRKRGILERVAGLAERFADAV